MPKSAQAVTSLPLDQERLQRKRALAAAIRIFARRGFEQGTAGGLSVRDPEWPDRIWTARPGVHPALVRVADLVADDRALPPLQRAIYRNRPDVAAVVHVPSTHGQAWSTLGRRLDPITAEACAFYDDHIVDPEFAFDEAEGARIASALGRRKAAILRARGLLTVGSTIETAAWWFLAFESAIQTQMLAEAVAWPQPLDDATARDAHDRVGSETAGHQSFQPLYDWIVRLEPDLLD